MLPSAAASSSSSAALFENQAPRLDRIFECDRGCGYTGSYLVVSEHEEVCAGSFHLQPWPQVPEEGLDHGANSEEIAADSMAHHIANTIAAAVPSERQVHANSTEEGNSRVASDVA